MTVVFQVLRTATAAEGWCVAHHILGGSLNSKGSGMMVWKLRGERWHAGKESEHQQICQPEQSRKYKQR